MKPFTRWIMKQDKRDDRVGDLGRDFKRDPRLPIDAGIRDLRQYLSRYGDHVLEAYEQARAEYREERKGRVYRWTPPGPR